MKKITLLPGDGIGPEITASVTEVFAAAEVPVEWEQVECGIDEFKRTGTLISDDLHASLNKNRIALKGPTTTPVGSGHRSINVTLRQEHQLFANVRPVVSIEGLNSPIKNVDIITVRENSEDLYKGVEYKVDDNVAHGIKVITRDASTRIAKHAFELAKMSGRKHVSAVHKANIMKLTDGLFLEACRDVAKQYPDIEFDDVIVDACCMQLVTKPERFDVIVTENLYGDIISDLASGLIGGLGVAAGANLGENKAVFEAVHGSAPDIAGKGIANPTALLFSSLMMLEYLDLKDHAKRIRAALDKCLASPDTRTGDLGGKLDTAGFTKAIVNSL